MAPPPPPPAPPPPGPPPPPMASAPKVTTDRNALLSQIRGGAKLKKTTCVNDRSAPLIDGKSSSQANSSGSRSSNNSKPTANGPMQLGGLFADGMPKLRATGNKLLPSQPAGDDNSDDSRQRANRFKPKNSTASTTTIKSSLEEKLQNSIQNSFLHPKTANTSESTCNGVSVPNKYHTISGRGRNQWSDTPKGHAPPVPSNENGRGPELPVKPPAIQRSNSQSNGRRVTRPPATKPPPPPKTSNGLASQPNKPVGVGKKPSFGENDFRHVNGKSEAPRPPVAPSVASLKETLMSQNSPLKPPAPPRNTSVSSNQSPNYPPPPPPISTIPSKSVSGSTLRLPSDKNGVLPAVNLTRVHSQSSARPPTCPPPPPPHRTTSNSNNNNSALYPAAPPPPPSQTKVLPNQMVLRNGPTSPAPPPPARNTSMAYSKDFSSRFSHHFKPSCELPAPTPFTNCLKTYSSQMCQSQRRNPPPPPPPTFPSHTNSTQNLQQLNAHNNNNKKYTSNPMLHIHIGSSVAQC